MRVFLGVLSAVSLFLAARRFHVSESAGNDIGALFLLLIGIQLLIAAALVHEHRHNRAPKPPSSMDRGKGDEGDPVPKP